MRLRSSRRSNPGAQAIMAAGRRGSPECRAKPRHNRHNRDNCHNRSRRFRRVSLVVPTPEFVFRALKRLRRGAAKKGNLIVNLQAASPPGLETWSLLTKWQNRQRHHGTRGGTRDKHSLQNMSTTGHEPAVDVGEWRKTYLRSACAGCQVCMTVMQDLLPLATSRRQRAISRFLLSSCLLHQRMSAV